MTRRCAEPNRDEGHRRVRSRAVVAPTPPTASPPPEPTPPEGLEGRGAADAADTDARVDSALEGSFPASDPPPWTLGPPRWVKPRG